MTSVDFECAGRSQQKVPAACQNCDADVHRDEEHITVTIWLNLGPIRRAEQRMAIAYFCSRDCWASWASATE